jgi:hypothetical protein
MNLTVQTDLRGLNEFQSQLFGALLGQGKSGEGDTQRFLKIETGQLAKEIATQLGPKNLAKAESKIKSEAKQTFFSIQPEVGLFTGSRAGTGEIKWLFAFKHKGGSSLVGDDPEDFMPGLDIAAGKEIMRRSNKKRDAWRLIGTRGKGTKQQKIYKIERVITKTSVVLGVVKAIKQKAGQLKASFAYTASELGSWNSVPSWVSRHFSGLVSGKAILNRSQEHNVSNPFIEFGSRAPGVVSNQRINSAIIRAYQARCRISIAKLKKIMAGHTYDWNTGRVFKPQSIPTT